MERRQQLQQLNALYDSGADFYDNVMRTIHDLYPVFIVGHNFDSPLARLYPNKEDRGFPFCLTEIDGIPLLQHTIHSLYIFGIEHFAIITVPEFLLELESFVSSIMNSQARRALISLNFCKIEILVNEFPLFELKKLALQAQNLFVINANVFFFGVPELISFYHRKYDSTMTLLYDQDQALNIQECVHGSCVLSQYVEKNVSKIKYFRAIREEMLSENYNNQLELYPQLIDATYQLQLKTRLPSAMILASELVPYLCIEEFREMGIFDDLVEFVVEQSNVDDAYLHPTIHSYYHPEVSFEDETYYQIGDILSEERRLCIYTVGVENNLQRLALTHKWVKTSVIETIMRQIQEAIYLDRNRNRNASFMEVGALSRTTSMYNFSIQQMSELKLNTDVGKAVETYIILPDSRAKMLGLTILIRRALLYPYPCLAVKYATIDAYLVSSSKKAQAASSFSALGSAAGKDARASHIDLYKMNSIFAMAKDDNYLLGGLRSLVYVSQDSGTRQETYYDQFRNTKNSTLGINIECKGGDVRIEDCYIDNSVTIYAGSVLKNCIVLEQARVGGRLENCIIGKNAVLIVEQATDVIMGCNTVYPASSDRKVVGRNMG